MNFELVCKQIHNSIWGKQSFVYIVYEIVGYDNTTFCGLGDVGAVVFINAGNDSFQILGMIVDVVDNFCYVHNSILIVVSILYMFF